MRTKKLLSRIFIGVFMCLCLLFTACGRVEGTYKFKKMSYIESGVTYEIVAGEKVMGAMILTKDFIVLTLEENGVAKMTFESGAVRTGNWTKLTYEKNAISFTIGKDSFKGLCHGRTLTFNLEGRKITLEKTIF